MQHNIHVKEKINNVLTRFDDMLSEINKESRCLKLGVTMGYFGKIKDNFENSMLYRKKFIRTSCPITNLDIININYAITNL